MALLTKSGTFVCPTSNGTLNITGLGFQPKLIIFRRLFNTSSGRDFEVGLGAAAQDGQWSVFGYSDDTASISNSSRYISTSNAVSVIAGSSIQVEASLDSFDIDGFTLDFVTTSGGYGFTYHAFGGDLDVSVGTVNMPDTVADFSKSGLSFEPKVVQVASVFTGLQDTLETSIFLNFGTALSPSDQFSIMVSDRDGNSPTDTFRYQSGTSILKRGLTSGDPFDLDVKLSSMNSDGFTLHTHMPPGGAQELPYIAWGGNINAVINRIVEPVSDGVQSVNTGFSPAFTFTYDVSLNYTEEDSDLTIINASMGLGFSDGSYSIATFASSSDSATSTIAWKVGVDGIVYFDPSGVRGLATYQKNSTGYDLTWSSTDGIERAVYALSIGELATLTENSDTWSISATTSATFDGIKTAADNIAIEQTINASAAGTKHSSDAMAIASNIQLQIGGIKHTFDTFDADCIAVTTFNGIKASADNWPINTAAHPQINGTKHSSGSMAIAAYCVVDWQGSSDVTRTGTFTIQSIATVTMGGIKHANDSFNVESTVSAGMQGIKLAQGAFGITCDSELAFDGTKHSAGSMLFNAIATVNWVGYSSETPSRSRSISLHGVVQSLHLSGVKQSLNIRGYL